MKRRALLLALLCLTGWMLHAQDARDIVRKANDLMHGASTYAEISMTITKPEWSRTIDMKVWSVEPDYSLVYVTEPARDRGSVTLKRKNEVWNWLPSVQRIIKIPPSMMLQSWMGSDFTNDDLVKQSSIVVDYTHKMLGREKVRDMDCYKIELIPLPDAAVVWGKVIMWITVGGFDQWMTEYYDEDNVLVNVSNSYEIKRMGDRMIPTRLEMVPQHKKGQKTIMHIDDMRFDIKIDEGFFSQQNMKKIK